MSQTAPATQPIIFHLGYPKAGSTSLQTNLFLNSMYFNNVLHQGYRHDTRSLVPRAHTEELTLALKSESPDADARFSALWQKAVSPTLGTETVAVASDENLLFGDAPPETVLGRIQSVAPDAQILLVLRSQADILRSLYDMSPVLAGRCASGMSFPNWVEWLLAGNTNFAERLNYSPVLEGVISYFGKSSLIAVNFSDLFRLESAEMTRISRAMNLPAHVLADCLAQSAANDFQVHSAKRAVQRLLGPVRPSWFLPHNLRRRLLLKLSLFIDAQRTELPEASRRRITDAYASDTLRMREILADHFSI